LLASRPLLGNDVGGGQTFRTFLDFERNLLTPSVGDLNPEPRIAV